MHFAPQRVFDFLVQGMCVDYGMTTSVVGCYSSEIWCQLWICLRCDIWVLILLEFGTYAFLGTHCQLSSFDLGFSFFNV